MEQKEYIEERMRELAMNIADFSIGDIVKCIDGRTCRITDKSLNTIQVFMERKTNKGIDCKQWFDMKNFNKIFKK